ncbi:UDP-glucuronosyl/UDP-glucosyltransferase [Artemisia annua]|uniref:Glycosyltransferase n=1 Tax=Artemisia annua TaxID=35608 RepID=A0A2U1L847_ARTAN|nr:UDP-glucuronosyl/UDP-glucosyltransferase [Artemisia annua]
METVVVNNENKKPHVVCIPVPAQSHIKCMLKLARLLHHKGLNITFVNTLSNHMRLLKSDGTHDLYGAPSFQFKTVPDGLSSTSDADNIPSQTWPQLSSYLATNFFDSFLDLVSELEAPVTCIISDGFMNFAKTYDVAEKLKVPIILYWTLSACGFMGYYQAKVLVEKGLVPLKDESYLTNGYTDMVMDWIPGMEGVRLRDLPRHILATKPDDHALNFLVETAQLADKVLHNVIHTFDELESTLVKELKSIFPHIYTVGPLQLLMNQVMIKETNNSSFNGYSLWNEEPECIQWLQSKEPNSVVYVNFGSLAVMSLEDLIEFGWGLVDSNHYFLWIIRTDLVDGGSLALPPELEEGIKRRGFIASWCSQEEVLNHPSIGGFLTHGGWGSVIESLSAGVPMLCWPVSHDQRINCIQMSKKWEVGMEIGKNVNRHEVEKLVRELMDGIKGNRLRLGAMEWKTKAEIATAPNGSSFLNVEELVHEITMLSRN